MRIAQIFVTTTSKVHIRYRHLHGTSYQFRSHDVLARFRQPSSRPEASGPSLLTRTETTSDSKSGTFETSSTEPAGMSFQQVPSPDIAPIGAGHLAIAVPAMKDAAPADAAQHTGSEGGRMNEKLVLGVTIPPKPRPPAEEGTLSYIRSSSFELDREYYTYPFSSGYPCHDLYDR